LNFFFIDSVLSLLCTVSAAAVVLHSHSVAPQRRHPVNAFISY